jgi:hypothetical protein
MQPPKRPTFRFAGAMARLTALLQFCTFATITIVSTISFTAFAQESNAVIRFKEILSSAPNVSEIEFASVLADHPTSVAYFTAASNGTNFFIRRHLSNENVHTPLSPTNKMGFPYFLGKDDKDNWEISGLKIFKSPLTMDAPPLTEHGEYVLDSALTFGLAGILPGSFVWKGNQFTAKRSNTKHLVTIEKTVVINGVTQVTKLDTTNIAGELIVSNGVPSRIETEDGTCISLTF